jgi:hypothetical protein
MKDMNKNRHNRPCPHCQMMCGKHSQMCPAYLGARGTREQPVKDREVLGYLDFDTPDWADIDD